MSSVPIALVSLRANVDGTRHAIPETNRLEGLTFSYKPGVHRFVMSGLEVRTGIHCPADNIIISV